MPDCNLVLGFGGTVIVGGRIHYLNVCLAIRNIAITFHTMDMLWEKFQWIRPLYLKPISFQSKASVVCSVIDFCLKKLDVFSQHIGKKIKHKWISELYRTNHKDLKSQSNFCVNYCLRYYLMMQHQPIVKRVDTSEHTGLISSYQLLITAACISSYQLLITAACTNTGGKMEGSRLRVANRCPFVPRHS